MILVKGYKVRRLWPGKNSSLALSMARVFADHAHHVLALDDLASFTKSFY
jgi:hypothetical protein